MKRSRYIREENVVIRKEYFGGVGFHRGNGITMEFDEEAYVLLSLLSKPLSLLQIKDILEQRFKMETWHGLLKEGGFEVKQMKFKHSTFAEGGHLPVLVCTKPL